MKLRRGTSTPALLAACSAAAIVAAGGWAKAQECPRQPPNHTIKIYNDSKGRWIFPVLELGKEKIDEANIWMQAICKVPDSKTKTLTYRRTLTFRFYINPTKGIAPGESVVITLPLFTQLVANVDPTQPNQYAEWWQGQNLQLFTSTSAAPPKALKEDYDGTAREGQKPLESEAPNPTWPTCTGASCKLDFFTDTDGTLPKNGPSQLLEATLGARQALKVVDDSPPNKLDIANADFDVSYVNLAYTGAAMGPYQNDQVGYVGTDKLPQPFENTVNKFRRDFPGWPRFIVNYADGTTETIPKLPSPLEVLPRLTGEHPPPDLEPIPDPAQWPKKVWPPIQALRDDFTKYTSSCKHSVTDDTFCDALLDVNQIILDNYKNYLTLFNTGVCKGQPVDDTGNAILMHVYGWTPWTESKAGKEGEGCAPAANLLENTPGYGKENKLYAKYMKFKLEFDKLQYNLYPDALYVFDPWVEFIHGENYLDIEGAYAYSVDDAVGNVQAEAKGYIVDFGSLKNLENQLPAAPPINIGIGFAETDPIRFQSYRLCSNDPARNKPVDPLNPTFIINANEPKNCPVFLIDNKERPQFYTFTVVKPPPFTLFTLKQVQDSFPKWRNSGQYNTTSVIACDGNKSFAESSKVWCCSLTSSAGVWAYSFPEVTSPHKAVNNYVITNPPQASRQNPDVACNMGH
jgi:hypothetical protein